MDNTVEKDSPSSFPQKIEQGRVPLWLRQKSLVSVSAETMRPGGFSLTERGVNYCNFKPGYRILDAGCGRGMTQSFLMEQFNLNVIGTDIDRQQIRRARQKNLHGQIYRSCLTDLPVRDNTVHGIFCECTLSQIKDQAACLEEFRRILIPDGRLVIIDLYLRKWAPAYQRPNDITDCMSGASPLVQMMEKIETAGFSIDIIEDHTPLLRQLGTHSDFHRCRSLIGYTMIVAAAYA